MLKRIIVSALCLTLIFCGVFSVNSAGAEKPSVSAEAAVLYCVNNGKTYFSLNENKPMKNASTTKIMTALLALEEAAKDNKRVKFTQEMTAEGSSMYLEAGDVLTLKDLAAGMMTCSGNDGANAAAVAVAGSYEKFAEKMNAKAKQLGMKNTNFVTPSGLDDDNHYSCAYDLALLMAYALENGDFSDITSRKSVTVNFISPKEKSLTYSNHNRLLSMYEYCIGGKTGYTQSAGRCLVSAAEKDGLRFVCVTLNDKNDWKDHQTLYNYGFDNYALCDCGDDSFYLEVPVVGGTEDFVTVGGDRSYTLVISKADADKVAKTVYMDNFLYAPVSTDDCIGKSVYTINGKIIAETPLMALSESGAE